MFCLDAYRYDALDASHALTQRDTAVASEVEAETQFNHIPYEKGASVLRMLHSHMLRTADGTSAEFESRAWWLRRSRKLLDASSAGAVQALKQVAGTRHSAL